MLYRKIKSLGDEDGRVVVSIYSAPITLLAKIICKKDQRCEDCKVRHIRRTRILVICGWCTSYIPENCIPDLDTMGISEDEFVHMFEGKVIKKKAREENDTRLTSRDSETR